MSTQIRGNVDIKIGTTTFDRMVTLTAGSIAFAGSSGVLTEDNAGLFWDLPNHRLGINSNPPSATLHLTNLTNGVYALRLRAHATQAVNIFSADDSSNNSLLAITKDGTLIGGSGHLKMDNTSGTVLDYNTATAWQLAGSFADLLVGGVHFRFNGTGAGFGTTSPSAVLHLKAGTATANTAPLKFTAGTLLTTAEAGAMEWVDNGTTGHLYITHNVAGVLTRVQIV